MGFSFCKQNWEWREGIQPWGSASNRQFARRGVQSCNLRMAPLLLRAKLPSNCPQKLLLDIYSYVYIFPNCYDCWFSKIASEWHCLAIKRQCSQLCSMLEVQGVGFHKTVGIILAELMIRLWESLLLCMTVNLVPISPEQYNQEMCTVKGRISVYCRLELSQSQSSSLAGGNPQGNSIFCSSWYFVRPMLSFSATAK